MKTKWLLCILVALLLLIGCVQFFMPSNKTNSDLPEEAVLLTESTQEIAPSTHTDEFIQPKTSILPKLSLNGDISGMYEKSDERVVAFSYDDGNQNIDGYFKIKIQGNSSIHYEKKNYTVKMYKDIDCNDKLNVDFGWGLENKYCMKANWIDQTHARNIVTARIASDIQHKYGILLNTPANGLIDGFPVEVYNNGEFLGLYTWNIPKDAWLFNMDSDNTDHIVVCGDAWDNATLFKGAPNFTSWELEVGEETEDNLDKLSRLFDFVMYSTDAEFVENIDNYLNLDSLLNYYLVTDMAFLKDNLGKNMLLFTYDSEVWYVGLYDLDTSWGVDAYGLTNVNNLLPQIEFPLYVNTLLQRIETCFADELARRYFELRGDIFTADYIMEEFHSFKRAIPDDVFQKEATRWENIPGFSYDQIEAYLNVRIPMLDEKYSNLDQWILTNEQRALTYYEMLNNTN